ncbi:MAG: hypothetical protein Q8K36_01800 [Alphaproteobacteria bacterium]|nr:hypothetical protein [Alphaproteobacteria bacterium]
MAILFMYFGGNLTFKRPVIDESTLIVDFTHIAEKTKAPLKSHQPVVQKKAEVKKAQPEKPQEPREQKQQTLDNATPEKPKEKVKEPVKEQKPETPSKEAIKKPEKKDKPKPVPAKKKDTPKDKNKKPAPQNNKSKPVQRNLDAKDMKSQKGAKNAIDDILDDVKDEESLDDPLDHISADESAETFTVSEIAALKAHISKCWNVHAGAKDARNHVVDIEIHLSPEGYVKQASILDKARMQQDPFYRVSAQAAQRSLLDEDCNPLPIPKSSAYEKWKVITFRFDPKEMF